MAKVSETWSNRDIQRDPRGYLAAQAKEREQAAAESEKDRERDAFERFKREFIAEGGDPGNAEAEYRRTRNERASKSVRAKEEARHRAMFESRTRAV
jgi:hypothetical protein